MTNKVILEFHNRDPCFLKNILKANNCYLEDLEPDVIPEITIKEESK